MGDLLQPQIRDSCRLAMPEGLKELMSDISREVLRSQPENTYEFIADYLKALIDTRDALSIACCICGEICNCSCQPELDNELRNIGLNSEDIITAKEIILEHFDKGQVKETSIMIKLSKNVSMTDTQLEDTQVAIQRAFQRYILKQKREKVSYSNSFGSGTESTTEQSASTESSSSDLHKTSTPVEIESCSTFDDSQTKEIYMPNKYRQCHTSESAISLAGSYIHLPATIPYSVHQTDDNVEPCSRKRPSTSRLLKSPILEEI